jgi:hypothetical protein
MTVTPREKALAAATLMALLYGLLGLSVRGRLEAYRTQRSLYRDLELRLKGCHELIGQRGQWDAQYAGLQHLMPVFSLDRRVDTYWLRVMDRLAAKNSATIVKPQIGAEQQVGDVFEMPIECREWESSLESLVGFLYDLQTEGVMLDVRQLFVKPTPGAPDRLRGTFTLYCAYMRDANVPASAGEPYRAAAAKPAAAAAAPAPAAPTGGPPAAAAAATSAPPAAATGATPAPAPEGTST